MKFIGYVLSIYIALFPFNAIQKLRCCVVSNRRNTKFAAIFFFSTSSLLFEFLYVSLCIYIYLLFRFCSERWAWNVCCMVLLCLLNIIAALCIALALTEWCYFVALCIWFLLSWARERLSRARVCVTYATLAYEIFYVCMYKYICEIDYV